MLEAQKAIILVDFLLYIDLKSGEKRQVSLNCVRVYEGFVDILFFFLCVERSASEDNNNQNRYKAASVGPTCFNA